MAEIRNECIRWSALVRSFGDKVREARLILDYFSNNNLCNRPRSIYQYSHNGYEALWLNLNIVLFRNPP